MVVFEDNPKQGAKTGNCPARARLSAVSEVYGFGSRARIAWVKGG